MKFGLVISIWLLWIPLFSQNCGEVLIDPVHYFVGSEQSGNEIHKYFVPCSNSKPLYFSVPSLATADYSDSDPSTPAGIILVLMLKSPDQSVLSISEFSKLIYRDLNGDPLFFSDPGQSIEVANFMNLGNVANEYVLMPVLADALTGTDPDSWFEEECVRIYPEQGLLLLENISKDYEFTHFDEISFKRWPADTSIGDFFDFTFTDQETGEEIPYVLSGNRTFKLKFPNSKGIFKFEMSWRNNECYVLEIGKNWEFPTIEVSVDKVSGFRNSTKCVPVRVRNFESVTGFYITFSWSPDSLSYFRIKNIHPALLPYLEIVPPKRFGDQEKMGLKLPANLDTLTLPDDSVLFEWCGKPLSNPGTTVHLAVDTTRDETGFDILGLEADNSARNGSIFVQEDREINYDLTQLCNTPDGKHRLQFNILNDEAYPYTYSFDSPLVADSVIHSLPLMITDIPAGQYEFTVRDSFGFEITEHVIVKENIPPDFKVEIEEDRVIQPNCINPWGGQIAVSINPQDQMYQLQLLNDGTSFTGDSIAGLKPGNYVIQVVDSMGCSDTLSYTLRNPREIEVSWDAGQLVLCPDVEDVVLRVEDEANIPDPTLEYQLNGGQIHEIGDLISLSEPGEYSLQLWNGDDCTLDTLLYVFAGPANLSVWDTTSIRVLLGDTLEFVSSEPDGLTELIWEYNGKSVGDETDIHFIPQEDGIFNFRATVYGRCVYTDSLMVQVIKPDMGIPEFEFPNVFSPNGDGVNDFYRIVPTSEIKQILRMEVFDRYGNFVFEEDYTADFDGKSRGWDGRHAGMDAAPGIYVVQIYLSLLDGREKQMGFDVLLIR